ncbi:hypothetical protein Nizo1840_1568 [Lactiplantibacillus plantarum]|nr:hypothetical protein SF2A35B_0400 [Lactiplantibacillus plantarum]KZT78892.1 hypothetical protein Nizo1839_2194 [Lactiplantibacillus plantarum]KZT83701.1 hypothetical protein Nizo1840_1568 [Lactiplantibacillus plantarum]KZU16201.1 hypothetical protein Nizo2264_0331 [Lactiplantibacillus plantarum]
MHGHQHLFFIIKGHRHCLQMPLAVTPQLATSSAFKLEAP